VIIKGKCLPDVYSRIRAASGAKARFWLAAGSIHRKSDERDEAAGPTRSGKMTRRLDLLNRTAAGHLSGE
jgi:hypothetical protein